METPVKGTTTARTLGEMVGILSCTNPEMEDTIIRPTSMRSIRTLTINKRAIYPISETTAERKAVSANWTFMLSFVRVHGLGPAVPSNPVHEIS